VREAVGPRVPIAASLDLHANMTRAMFETADALVAYRSYPHVDMAETGARAARLLERMLKTGSKLAHFNRGFDFLTGIPSQSSFIEPGRSLYRELGALEGSSDAVLSFTPGFPMADFDECGMAVFGYGSNPKEVDAAVQKLHAAVADSEGDFALELHAPDDAVKRAMQRGEPGVPVVLADTQDNPGAGGNGDTTGLLAALVRQQARDATLGLLIDGESAGARARGRAGRDACVRARRALGSPGRFAVRRRVHRRAPGRRAFYLHRADVPRLPDDARARWRSCAAARRPACASCSPRESARPPTRRCSAISASSRAASA
jgi:microcystin degradation protein MlrC